MLFEQAFGEDDAGVFTIPGESTTWEGATQHAFDAEIGVERQSKGSTPGALNGQMNLTNKHIVTFTSVP